MIHDDQTSILRASPAWQKVLPVSQISKNAVNFLTQIKIAGVSANALEADARQPGPLAPDHNAPLFS
jgi:hypothetical protein